MDQADLFPVIILFRSLNWNPIENLVELANFSGNFPIFLSPKHFTRYELK